MSDNSEQITWLDDEGQARSARWRSLAGHPAPARVVLADDRLSADAALRLIQSGTGLLWRGDYQNARHLLQALGRRLDAGPGRRSPAKPSAEAPIDLPAIFQAQRRLQAKRALVLGQLLLPFDADHGVPLPRAPEVRDAGLQAHGPVAEAYVASLRELLGLVGAFEWRKKGVPIAALGASIHPHHGVFSPVRGEYVDLVAQTKLPAAAKPARVLDVGTGTGVLAALLVKQGVKRVVGTDTSARALLCAQDNVNRLNMGKHITLQQSDLFPEGQADLIVCNPPWLPGRPASTLEQAVYDQDQHMLLGFLSGLSKHLTPKGQGWLILSDLAEHLGLRSRAALLAAIERAGLVVLERLDTR
ncbi:MAG: class I SAM-dependent methyltransferase, partial [Betaproteobacteria bacterium]|nr:class I SAM-dependent methyltransferase [Betaproteobacteria bacterium]